MPKLTKRDTNNFNSLIHAAKNDRVALMDCLDSETGKPVLMIAAVNKNEDGSTAFVPFATLIPSSVNAYERYSPPVPGSADEYR